MRRLLVLADIAGLTTAFLLTLVISPSPSAFDAVATRWELVLFALSLPLWILLARGHGLYDRDEERTDHSTVDDLFGVFQVVSLGTWGVVVITEITGLGHATLSRFVLFWFLAVLLVPLFRAFIRVLGRRNATYVQNVIIVGTGSVARLLASKISKRPEYGLRVVGFADRDEGWSFEGGAQLDLLGAADDLPALVRAHSVHRVIIAFSTGSHEETLGVIRSLHDSDVQVDIVPRMFEVLGTSAQLRTIEGIPLVGLPIPRLSASSRALKRSLDLVGAAGGLVLLSPLFLVTALCIELESRGPVFFRQLRMGEGGRPFRVFKFRTMVNDADARKAELAHLNMHRDQDPRMFKIPNDPRVTRVGHFLRRWRIDELPQLLNVLRGEMSLVGPRPTSFSPATYDLWHTVRLEVTPGLTGLWQVKGRNDTDFDQRLRLDVDYIRHRSLVTDFRIIGLTLLSVVRGEGA